MAPRQAAAPPVVEARYFSQALDLRHWFAEHHASASDLLVGFWKLGSGQPSISWPESVDEALCVGWIDGLRRRVDEHRYSIRFTPRRPGSVWSRVNVQRIAVLQAEGRLQPGGLAVFQARGAAHEHGYSFSDRPEQLPSALETLFRSQPEAFAFFCAQPPGYRRNAVHWVSSAKQAATQQRRLAELMACSAAGQRHPRWTP